MNKLAIALGIMLVSSLSVNAAETKKGSTEVKAKAPVVAIHKSSTTTFSSVPKKLHKKVSIEPTKAK